MHGAVAVVPLTPALARNPAAGRTNPPSPACGRRWPAGPDEGRDRTVPGYHSRPWRVVRSLPEGEGEKPGALFGGRVSITASLMGRAVYSLRGLQSFPGWYMSSISLA